jgi:hypothetical protein
MPGLDPGIRVFQASKKVMDGRDKPGHDGERVNCYADWYYPLSQLFGQFLDLCAAGDW